jgi:hypothetical protein
MVVVARGWFEPPHALIAIGQLDRQFLINQDCSIQAMVSTGSSQAPERVSCRR